jgi:hypothetical protein
MQWVNTDTYTYMSNHLYEYMYIHLITMNTFERLSRFDLKTHEAGHQERIAVDEDIISH